MRWQDITAAINQIPVAIEARLDNRPGEFALDSLAIKLGELQVSGSAVLSGTDRRKLTMDLKGAHMDLGFLFNTADSPPLPGIALPEYLAVMPDLDLNLTVYAENLQAPGLSLGQASATLQRSAQGGKFEATAKGTNFGSLDLTLEASTPADKPSAIKLTANFTDMDIPDIFRQKGLINSRSTGSLDFSKPGPWNQKYLQRHARQGTDSDGSQIGQQLASRSKCAGKTLIDRKFQPDTR